MITRKCENCGFEYFMNPSAANVAFIVNENDELLVERRKNEPAKGMLDLPGGFTDIGETAEEVNIASGISYKKPGVDGVVGEAVDVMLCLLDLIHKYDPTITKEQINALAEAKCQKWLKKLDEDANR